MDRETTGQGVGAGENIDVQGAKRQNAWHIHRDKGDVLGRKLSRRLTGIVIRILVNYCFTKKGNRIGSFIIGIPELRIGVSAMIDPDLKIAIGNGSLAD